MPEFRRAEFSALVADSSAARVEIK